MGKITINSAANDGPIMISVGYDEVFHLVACSDASVPTYTRYIEPGTSFASTTKLYQNSTGTVRATTGWYSNGTINRYWSSTENKFGITSPCTGPAVKTVNLGYDPSNQAHVACDNAAEYTDPLTIPSTELFPISPLLFPQLGVGSYFAANGIYSDGNVYRQWDDKMGFILNDICENLGG